MGSRQVRLTAVLRDSAGNPLANKTVVFEYKASGAAQWTSAGTANTDSNGAASVTVTVAAPGAYDFRARFQGDDQYEASEATVTNYIVKDRTVVTLTVAAL
jgi:5-hydroxyisourate hydrolase-like protein (transthyretin family)